MKLLKISVYALCLSTMVGISTMAMENGKQDVSTGRQVQAVSDRDEKVMDEKRLEKIINDEMSQGESEKYSKFYADLIVKGKLDKTDARDQAAIFEKEVASGKSFIYAQYYSMLIVMRKVDTERAMFQSEVFEREFKTNKNFKKADYYATNIILHDFNRIKLDKLKAELLIKANTKARIRMCEEILRTIEREVECRSYYYLIAYISLVLKKESLEVASRIAEIVDEEMKYGKCHYYVRNCADLSIMDQPEKMRKGKSDGYLMEYIEFMLDSMSGGVAREGARLIDREVKKKKSGAYAIEHADSILNGKSEEIARKELDK